MNRQSSIAIRDQQGNGWQLTNGASPGQPPVFELIGDKRRIALPDFAILADQSDLRLQALRASAERVKLPSSSTVQWREVLSQRSLHDEEVLEFFDDIQDTPAHISDQIFWAFQDGEVSFPTLVPHSKRYFERLVGKYEHSTCAPEYAQNEARTFLARRCARKSVR